eukprot:GHVH01004267.1.p1 GENE.GHVH01004267.1~~GHVH01004267.1.p1  ORF type:complete len:467 (+),score=71.15 GHVH01004267.1:79-1479(+)
MPLLFLIPLFFYFNHAISSSVLTNNNQDHLNTHEEYKMNTTEITVVTPNVGDHVCRRSSSNTVELMEFAEISNTMKKLENEIVTKCLASVPGWDKLQQKDLIVNVLRGGLSNSLFTVEVNEAVVVDGRFDRKVLIRYYGNESGQFYDASHELATFKALSERGSGPRLIASFPKSRIEQFIQGRTCDVKDYQSPLVMALVGAQLARFHNSIEDANFLTSVGVLSVSDFDPLSRLNEWMELADEAINKTMKFGSGDWDDHITAEVERIMEDFLHREWTSNPRVIFQEMKEMATNVQRSLMACRDHGSEAEKIAFRKVFSHNDLHVLNMIMSPDGLLTLIDVEYSQVGFAGQDFANLFVESSFDFEVNDRPFFTHSFHSNISLMGRKILVATYLHESGLYNGIAPDSLVDEFLAVVEKFEIYMYLLWGFWAMIRAPTAKDFNAGNFDFIAYAFTRFGLAKELLLSSDQL